MTKNQITIMMLMISFILCLMWYKDHMWGRDTLFCMWVGFILGRTQHIVAPKFAKLVYGLIDFVQKKNNKKESS